MKVGDLVMVTHPRLHGETLKKGSCGVVIEVHGPTIMFAYEVVTVVFSDGTLMEGIPSRWFGVINESN
tara:strand:- start:410 stop:613 length:204 start_codon:yes stop_codon:yes gene_type:complete